MKIFNAIEDDDNALLARLISSGAELNVRDEFGQTPLHIAIDMAFEEAIFIAETKNKIIRPKMEIIEVLLKNGVNHLIKDKKGRSPIDWAEDRNDEQFLCDLKNLIKLYNTAT